MCPERRGKLQLRTAGCACTFWVGHLALQHRQRLNSAALAGTRWCSTADAVFNGWLRIKTARKRLLGTGYVQACRRSSLGTSLDLRRTCSRSHQPAWQCLQLCGKLQLSITCCGQQMQYCWLRSRLLGLLGRTPCLAAPPALQLQSPCWHALVFNCLVQSWSGIGFNGWLRIKAARRRLLGTGYVQACRRSSLGI